MTKANSEQEANEEHARALVRLTEEKLNVKQRRQLLHTVLRSSPSGLSNVVRYPNRGVRWVVENLLALVPHIPIRDRDTLLKHYGNHTTDQIAEELIVNASRVSAAIGAAGGGVAAVEWVAPPLLLTAPALIAVETTVVIAVEIKLIAELQALYGYHSTTVGLQRGAELLGAWARRRGVRLLAPGRKLTATVVSVGLRRELSERVLRRMGRNLTSIGPFLTGATIAAVLNQRATKKLGRAVADDLRRVVGNLIEDTSTKISQDGTRELPNK